MKKLIALIKEAGALALKEQESMVVSTKEDTSIVTSGDIAVSMFLEKKLKELYPDYEIFSEENCENIPKGKKVIVIDPIDGTQSYSRKQDTWCILIGFLNGPECIKGLVYQPTKDILYYGERGRGSFKVVNGITTRLNSNREGNIKAYSSPTRVGENEFLATLPTSEIEYMYSASLKIMEIAQGNGDIYPNFQKKCSCWDLIAPLVILREAGGDIIYENATAFSFKNPRINTRFCAVGPKFKNFKF